jgi:hypothetical protein
MSTPARPRVGALLCAVIACAAGAATPAASATQRTPTAQAIAAEDTLAPYLPAPAAPVAVCLVDTGVNVNPATETSVIERTAIDGGTGNDVSSGLHGTELTMMAAAPAGWGTVGLAPGAVRVVSVRILEPGANTFPFDAYAAGITECLELRKKDNIRVINLSLGDAETPSDEAYNHVTGAIERAINYHVAVVAAAGNDDGGPVEFPASASHVLSVGASDTQGGAFCGFSNRGEGLALLAPGCDLNGTNPLTGEGDYNYYQGTSEASMLAATALAQLIAYAPNLTVTEAEQDLTGARNGTLAVEQSFRNAGLAGVLAAGEAAEPKPPSSPTGPPPTQAVSPLTSSPLTTPFPAPIATIDYAGRHARLRITARPAEARIEARYLTRRPHQHRLSTMRTLTGFFSSLTLPAAVLEIQLRYIDPYDVQRDSQWVSLTVSKPRKHSQTR